MYYSLQDDVLDRSLSSLTIQNIHVVPLLVHRCGRVWSLVPKTGPGRVWPPGDSPRFGPSLIRVRCPGRRTGSPTSIGPKPRRNRRGCVTRPGVRLPLAATAGRDGQLQRWVWNLPFAPRAGRAGRLPIPRNHPSSQPNPECPHVCPTGDHPAAVARENRCQFIFSSFLPFARPKMN